MTAEGNSLTRPFHILALDGGGIRGVFSAALLAAVEEDLCVTAADCFDLIAGTSTGGIIAIGLGLGLQPRELLQFYLAEGPRIFADHWRTRSLGQWLHVKYPSSALEAALRRAFQASSAGENQKEPRDRFFGESTKRLVVPAYNLGGDDVYNFRTPHAERLRRDYRVPAWQVAMSTAAAPTYFPAFRGVDGIRLVDGGVWANNPAMVAVIEAYGTLGIGLDRISVLSIGTCDPVGSRPTRLDRGGRLAWALDATDVILRAESISVTNHVRFLVGEDHLLRIDPVVAAAEVTLDGVRSVEELVARARHHSRTMMPEIARRFASHRADPYTPLYTVGEEPDGG